MAESSVRAPQSPCVSASVSRMDLPPLPAGPGVTDQARLAPPCVHRGGEVLDEAGQPIRPGCQTCQGKRVRLKLYHCHHPEIVAPVGLLRCQTCRVRNPPVRAAGPSCTG